MQATIEYPPPRAHYNDPHTSFMAAGSVQQFACKHYGIIFGVVSRNPGLTGSEIAAESGSLTQAQVMRRVGEMANKGLVRRGERRICAVAGTMAGTWWPRDRRNTDMKG